MRGWVTISTTALLLAAAQLHAGDMRFRFSNPSFGGDPMATSHFMKLLEAQKMPKPAETDAIQQFTEDLERRLLSGLATEISTQIFGQDGTTDGNFSVGGLEVSYETIGADVVVTLTDGLSLTEIIVPAF